MRPALNYWGPTSSSRLCSRLFLAPAVLVTFPKTAASSVTGDCHILFPGRADVANGYGMARFVLGWRVLFWSDLEWRGVL